MADYVVTLALMKVILSRWCLFNVLIALLNWFSVGLGNRVGGKGMVVGGSRLPDDTLGRAAGALGEAPSHLDKLCMSGLGERRSGLWFLSELQQQ